MDIRAIEDLLGDPWLLKSILTDPPPRYYAGDRDVGLNASSLDEKPESLETQNELEREIERARNSAQAVEIAFRNVSRGLAKTVTIALEGGQPQDSTKLGQFQARWDIHHEKYVELIWESRRVARDARAIATDFSGHFFDVIKSQVYSIKEKKQEIVAYRRELEKNMEDAKNLSQGFTVLHEEMKTLSEDIDEYVRQEQNKDAAIAEMNEVLDEKETVRRKLPRGRKEFALATGLSVLGVVCPPLWIGSTALFVKGVKQASRYLDKRDELSRKLDECENTVEVAIAITETIDSLGPDMVFIQRGLETLAKVWIIIRSDLVSIEKDLELASTAKLRFEKKIETVSACYRILARALRLYEAN